MYRSMAEEIENLTEQVAQQAGQRFGARLLMTHPGVGPVTALATDVFLGDPGRFADGKALASYVGLIPREYSSGERQRLGAIPAIKVDINRPSTPYFAMMPKTITTNAPVGPPICVFDPPRAEITKPATIAQYRPASGGTPEAMAKAIARGRATRPTVTPDRTSAKNNRLV